MGAGNHRNGPAKVEVPADATPPTDGKKAVGSFLKSKGVAIGAAIGVALTSLGDYLLGDTGLIAFAIGLIKQAWAFF